MFVFTERKSPSLAKRGRGDLTEEKQRN